MLKEHRNMIPANDDDIIWRYIDFPTFYGFLVNKSLFFKRLDAYSDKKEGMLPPQTVTDYHKIRWSKDYTTKAEADKWIENELANIASYKQFILSNSWNMGIYENYNMWKVYTRGASEGVAIQTTVGKLRNQLAANTQFSYIYSGKVSYNPIPANNIDQFTVATNKSGAYASENEYRVLILHQFRLEKDDKGNDIRKPLHDVGAGFTVDPGALIDKVYISPFAGGWFEPVLKAALTERIPGFDVSRVVKSIIDDK